MQGLTLSITLLLALAISDGAVAEIVKSKGFFVHETKSSSPSKSEKSYALYKAKANSIELYLSNFRESAAEVYARCPLEKSNLSDVVKDSRSVGKPKFDKDTKEYKVKVVTQIDTTQLDQHLSNCIAHAGNRIAVVLVARQQTSEFNESEYQSFFGHLDESVSSELVRRGFAVDTKQDMQLFSGGFYRQGRLVKQYEYTGTVNWESAILASDMVGAEFLTVGYFDVGESIQEPDTGLYVVGISGVAEILDLYEKRKIPTSVMQIKAKGVTKDQALSEAVQIISKQIGTELADGLTLYFLR